MERFVWGTEEVEGWVKGAGVGRTEIVDKAGFRTLSLGRARDIQLLRDGLAIVKDRLSILPGYREEECFPS